MQKIAKQMNLVESVFIFKGNKDFDFELKYFTPNKKLPIAGHPTISAFSGLMENGLLVKSKNEFLVKTGAGIINVKVDYNSCDILLKQPKPIFLGETKDIKRIADIFGVKESDFDLRYPIAFVSTGLGHLIIPFKNLDSLMKAKRNILMLKDICTENAVSEAQIFTFETYDKNYDLHTRNICPREGIEDPACGTGSGALLAYIDRY